MGPKCAHKGAHGAIIGPKLQVEQTLIANSLRPTLMTKANQKGR
jgi:hypothetical protein